MRAKRSIFDSTRLRYSGVFCSVASRVVTINLYIYINASSRSRRFYVVGRSRRFVGCAASTQKNPTRAYPRGVARTSSHTPHFLFPCSNSLSFCHKAHPVRVRDDVLLVLDVRAVHVYSKQRAPRAAHARVHVIASKKHDGAVRIAPFGFWKSGSSWRPTLLAKGWNVYSDRRRVQFPYICQALVVRILHLVVGVVLRWFATKPRPRPRRAHDRCRDKLRWLRVKCEQRTAAKAAPLNAYRRKVYEAIAAGVARYAWYPSLSGLSAS